MRGRLYPEKGGLSRNMQKQEGVFLREENARATFDFCYRFLGPIAQWLEQGSHKPLVPGSNPGGPISLPRFFFLSPFGRLFSG